MLNFNNLYETNNDFREYVNKYAVKHGIDISVALTHKIIQQYGLYLAGIDDER